MNFSTIVVSKGMLIYEISSEDGIELDYNTLKFTLNNLRAVNAVILCIASFFYINFLSKEDFWIVFQIVINLNKKKSYL